MRKIIFAVAAAALVAAWCVAADGWAASIKLQVDPLGQEYDEIRIYSANVPREFDMSAPPAYVGQETTATIAGLEPGQTYKFAAVLVRGEDKSGASNIVQQRMPVIVLIKPPQLSVIEIRGE